MKKKIFRRNHRERIFDDANRRIKEMGMSSDCSDEIPNIGRGTIRIPFPYGEENNRNIGKSRQDEERFPERNPYERIFDDANRRIKEIGISPDCSDEIPNTGRDTIRIPFPYGEENNRGIQK